MLSIALLNDALLEVSREQGNMLYRDCRGMIPLFPANTLNPEP